MDTCFVAYGKRDGFSYYGVGWTAEDAERRARDSEWLGRVAQITVTTMRASGLMPKHQAILAADLAKEAAE